LVATLLAVALSFGSPPGDTPAADDDAAPCSFEAARGEGSFTGIVAEQLYALEGEARECELSRVAAAGVQLIRQPMRWAEIERTRGELDFSRWDSYVAALAGRGIEILPVLVDPPPFRSSAPRRAASRGIYPPRRPREMGAFARRVAARYGSYGRFWDRHPELPRVPIRSWQVWNEPNLPFYWRPRPSARAYAELLRAVGDGIEKADPTAEIVTAGVPQSTWRRSIPQLKYLRALYAAGAGRSFDTLAIHPYTETHRDLERQLEAARRIVRRAGDDARLWITEIGWATQGPGARYTPGLRGQARRLRQVFELVRRDRRRLRIRGLVYYMWQDAPPYPGLNDYWGLHTGLLDISGEDKPALAVFRDQALRLR
jgi:hypothetical protein